MTDVLLIAYLIALADGDIDTARYLADLAGDDAAVAALLEDEDYSESYTPDEHALLSEAARAGLTLTQVGTHPRTGKPIMRWVRQAASGGSTVKPDRATARGTATRLVRDGVETAAEAKLLADSLKQMSTADIDGLKREFQARTGGRLKQEKVDRLVAYARGRGSVVRTPAPAPPPVTPTTPTAASIEAAVMGEVSGLFKSPRSTGDLIKIADLRDAMAAKYGREAAGQNLDAALNRMDLAGVIRLVEIDDTSRATTDEISKAIRSSAGLTFYIRKGTQWTN